MEKVHVSRFPTFFFGNQKSAEEAAKKHGVKICEIYTFDGNFIGFGLFDGRLLEQRDFVSV